MDAAKDLIDGSSRAVQPILRHLDRRLRGLNTTPYVKTIYIGYAVKRNLVAAVYPHTDHVEIALALDEDHPSPLLKDATHLTFRSLPVLVEIRNKSQLEQLDQLVDEAAARVHVGSLIELPVERYIARERRLSDRRRR